MSAFLPAMACRAFPPLALLVVLGACGSSAEPDPAESAGPAATAAGPAASVAPAPASTGEAILTPERLAGEYRVAGVGGEGIDLPYGITASITEETIRLSADCVNVEWGYILVDGRMQTARVPTEGCARGLTAIEGALIEALDGAEEVTRNASNGYEFSGRGPTAELYTQ